MQAHEFLIPLKSNPLDNSSPDLVVCKRRVKDSEKTLAGINPYVRWNWTAPATLETLYDRRYLKSALFEISFYQKAYVTETDKNPKVHDPQLIKNLYEHVRNNLEFNVDDVHMGQFASLILGEEIYPDEIEDMSYFGFMSFEFRFTV
jgi:hypothetical protein